MAVRRGPRSRSRTPRIWLHYFVIHLCVLYITLPKAHGQDPSSCMIEGFDLSALENFSPWVTLNSVTNATFKISLCNEVKKDQSSDETNCPDGTSVCAYYPDKSVINFGLQSSRNSSAGTKNGQLLVVYKGQACPEHDGELYSTFLYFKCGKTLGHPYHLGDIGSCYTHFQWESYIFCKDLPVPENEVPCTVMRNERLIDLSPLIKLTGAYLVDDANNKKIYINVCRDIKRGKDTDPSDPLSHCPNGAGSCHVINDSEGKDYGHPTQKLEATDSGVKLVYTSSSKPDGCDDNPTTTILFRCPKRGGSRDPVVLTDFDKACSVNIEWVTEYSCPIDYVSSKTCKLTSAQHDVDIDLSPLTHSTESLHPYLVNVTHGSDHYIYYINVCEPLGLSCGHGTSICQKKADDFSFSKSLGKSQFMKLRYSDQELTLIYSDGDECHTGFRRTSFIRFVCNRTAVNDGKGYPTFVSHENCSYTFEWQTKYACVDHLIDDTCRVDYKGNRYDLSPLVKEHGGSWQVLMGDSDSSDTSYYANICHEVLHQGPTAGCPAGSAMCAKGPGGFTSLGKFTQHLQYEEKSKSLKLVYTDGDKVGEKCVKSTVINFYCLPGVVDNAPILVHKSLDECYHEVEWHTAAACVLSHKKGDNCKVIDDDAGYTFDLTALKSDAKAYSVDTPHYTYYINVCDKINDDNNPCANSPHSGAAICQVEKENDKSVKKIGEPATLLEYYDGILNLTYTNGEPYNNADHTPRTAEIAFECDMTQDQGKPEFLSEKDFTYAFRWRTRYACPVPPVECAVTDTEKKVQYDLSRLSKTSENWVWMDDDSSKKNKQKFYINVCRPLVKSSNMHCSPFASVCVTNVDEHGKETISHGNLGRLVGPPQPEKTVRGAKIVYINGNDCEHDGVKTKFMTTLHIICSKGKLTGAPTKPVLIRPCEYSILWETEAGCPIEITSTSSPQDKGENGTCSIKDPNSDFIFNLKPLAKSGNDFYEVKSTDGKTVYKLNICHGLSDSVCGKFDPNHETSVCEGSSSVAMLASDLSYSSTGELSLEYKGKGHVGSGRQDKYTLNFFCERTAQTPVITFEKQEWLETIFHVKSALACPPEPVECLVQDNFGRQYDLSPLALKDKNWIVIDSRPTHSNLKYHINVCRPVNPTSGMACPGGAVGACQTGDQSFNLGYVQSKPIVSSNGSAITIVYQGGDLCHKGTSHEAYRSTRIIFTCSNVDHDPVFLVESDTCEYSFIWNTPSACAQHSTTGANCKVKESLYNTEFDLNALRKKTENYIAKGNGYDFILNICGPLVASSHTCTGENVGACQTGGGSSVQIELGKSNSDVIYDSGELRLVYTEGKGNCHGKFVRKTIIRFGCDESTSGEDGPSYVEEKSDCVYEFIWPTRLACPPHQVKDCTFQHGNDIYDLTALEKVHDNYEINNVGTKYILNVCRSLASKKGQTCPTNAAVCSIDLNATNEKKKYLSLGDVSTASFFIEQNKLLLRYSNGDLCTDGKTKNTAQINFECDKSSDALGVPYSHFIVNGCDHHFLWRTRAACPLVRTGGDNVKQEDFGDCKVKNPQTGYEFDLSSLKRSKGYKTYDRQGHLFTLNVCGWLDGASGCPNGTGSCQSGMAAGVNAVNAGKANANLIFRDGVIGLEYTGGKSCKKDGPAGTTIINFVCMPAAGNGVPVYVDQSDCLFYFDWHTDLVCEKQITCSVKTAEDHTLDFSPLVQHSGKYNVLPNTAGSNRSPGVIYLNLCRPLNPVFGTLCPPGSGACLVQDGQKPLSLGHVHDNMVYNANTREARLTYSHGDPCPSNPKYNTSSLIIFKCGHNDYSMDPELDSVTSDCVYVFVWITPYACEKNPVIPYSSCSFYDERDLVIHDLSSLTDEKKAPSAHGGTFTIKACGHFDENGEKGDASCSQAAICLRNSKGRDGSYGTYKDASVKVHTDSKAITFKGGRNCKSAGVDSKASTTIHFKCGSGAGMGSPVIIDDGDCDAVFEWSTSLVCPPVRKDCLVTDHGTLYDLSLLSQDTGSWNYTDSDGNIYWINLCQGVHGKALQNKCSHLSAICIKDTDGFTHTMGNVRTQSIQVIGENKDKTILVKYTDGDTSLCTRSRRRRSDEGPTVLISLKCADTIGAPVLEKHDEEKCSYEFTWKTRMACATEATSSPIKEENGHIKDKRSGQTINLNSLLKSGVNSEVNVGDQRYLVNLKGQLNLDNEQNGASICSSAAICHYSGKTKKYRNLGTFSQRKYYMFDEQLEVKFTSPEKCSGAKNSSHVSSTVIFDCVHNKTEHGLVFLYHTSDCAYVFMWKTDIVCIRPLVSGDITDSGKSNADAGDTKSASGSAGGSSKKILVGVLIFVFVAIICVMVVVLHKPEKRAAVKSGLKRWILCRRHREPNISYSMLSQSAEDDDLALKDDDYDPFNPFSEPDEEAEINNGHLPANLNPFHDDSDEDILT